MPEKDRKNVTADETIKGIDAWSNKEVTILK